MTIIFLDLDGVIVPDYHKVNDQAFPKYNDFDAEPFSRLAMNILNNVIMATNGKIVISSDWRRHYSLQSMQLIFEMAGILYGSDTIIGFTPILKTNESLECNRSDEIKSWVDLHKPERWVAIDDLDLRGYLLEDNFVYCSKPIEGIKQSGKRREIEIKLGY
jgi:hypothetical protein